MQAFLPSPHYALRAFGFIARKLELFFPWSTRTELRLSTMLGALSSWVLFFFLFANELRSRTHMRFEFQNQVWWHSRVTTRPPGRPAPRWQSTSNNIFFTGIIRSAFLMSHDVIILPLLYWLFWFGGEMEIPRAHRFARYQVTYKLLCNARY